MSLKRLVAYLATNTDDAVVKIKERMLAMGWTMHDDMSGEVKPYYVLKSNGEDSSLPYAYARIGKGTTVNMIDWRMYLYWDSGTHTGISEVGNYTRLDINADDDDTFYLWVYGNKDWVVVITKIISSYWGSFISKYEPYWDIKATLQGNSGTGTDKVLELGSGEAEPFIIGSNESLVCFDGTVGRQYDLTVSDVDRVNDTITISSDISYDFPVGSIIGYQPFPWGIGILGSLTYYQYMLSGSGTAAQSIVTRTGVYILNSYIDPDSVVNAYMLDPFCYTGTSGTSYMGIISGGIYFINYGATYEDMIVSGEKDNGIVSSSTNNTIDSTGQNWTTNEFTGKAIVITVGGGLGQSRTILSNTNEQIVVDENWSSNPHNGDTFVIGNKVFRYFGWSSSTRAFLESGEI